MPIGQSYRIVTDTISQKCCNCFFLFQLMRWGGDTKCVFQLHILAIARNAFNMPICENIINPNKTYPKQIEYL